MFILYFVLTLIAACATIAACSIGKLKLGYSSAAALIVCCFLSINQLVPSKPVEPSYKTINLTAISAQSLYDTYNNNIVKADYLYTNKHCLVTGRMIRIDKDSYTKKVHIVLGLSYGKVLCYLQKDKLSSVIDLEKGNLISIEGICHGIDGSHTEIHLTDCQVVNGKEEVKEAKVKIKEEAGK